MVFSLCDQTRARLNGELGRNLVVGAQGIEADQPVHLNDQDIRTGWTKLTLSLK